LASSWGARLYCINRDANQSRLACLASDDNRTTWHDAAVSSPVCSLYAIGGCREVTADGWVSGSFTDSRADPKDSVRGSKVFFIKFRAGLPLPRPVGAK
jgi:hypothetical protein